MTPRVVNLEHSPGDHFTALLQPVERENLPPSDEHGHQSGGEQQDAGDPNAPPRLPLRHHVKHGWSDVRPRFWVPDSASVEAAVGGLDTAGLLSVAAEA
jgi:hypothetical protein